MRQCAYRTQQAIDKGWRMPLHLGHDTNTDAGQVVGMWPNSHGGLAALIALNDLGHEYNTAAEHGCQYVSLTEAISRSGDSGEINLRYNEISLTPEPCRACSHTVPLETLQSDCTDCRADGLLARLLPEATLKRYIGGIEQSVQPASTNMAPPQKPKLPDNIAKLIPGATKNTNAEIFDDIAAKAGYTEDDKAALGLACEAVFAEFEKTGDLATAETNMQLILEAHRGAQKPDIPRNADGTFAPRASADSSAETTASAGRALGGATEHEIRRLMEAATKLAKELGVEPPEGTPASTLEQEVQDTRTLIACAGQAIRTRKSIPGSSAPSSVLGWGARRRRPNAPVLAGGYDDDE